MAEGAPRLQSAAKIGSTSHHMCGRQRLLFLQACFSISAACRTVRTVGMDERGDGESPEGVHPAEFWPTLQEAEAKTVGWLVDGKLGGSSLQHGPHSRLGGFDCCACARVHCPQSTVKCPLSTAVHIHTKHKSRGGGDHGHTWEAADGRKE